MKKQFAIAAVVLSFASVNQAQAGEKIDSAIQGACPYAILPVLAGSVAGGVAGAKLGIAAFGAAAAPQLAAGGGGVMATTGAVATGTVLPALGTVATTVVGVLAAGTATILVVDGVCTGAQRRQMERQAAINKNPKPGSVVARGNDEVGVVTRNPKTGALEYKEVD